MVPYLRVANVLDGYVDYSDVYEMHFSRSDQEKYTVRPGDILLNEGQSTELVGRSAIYKGPEGRYCYQNSLVNLRVGPRVDAHWARAVFKRWLDIGHFTTIVKQTTSMAHLGGDRFAKLDFPLPPLPEQRQIAAILDTLDDAIRKTEQIIAKLKQVKQGLLHDLLTRGIDDNGELRDPERHPEQFKDSALGRIPKEWDVSELEPLLVSSVDGPFGSNLKTEHYVEEPGVRLVRLQNIGVGEFLNHEKAWISERHAQTLARHDVQPGDVLVASLGDPTHPFARSCVYTEDVAGVVKADCFRLRLGLGLDGNFLAGVLNTWRWRRGLAGLVHRSGISRDRVNLNKLRRLLIPVAPIEEQRAISARGVLQTARLRSESDCQEKLKLLKCGLMEDLLTGRVRVTPLTQAGSEPSP